MGAKYVSGVGKKAQNVDPEMQDLTGRDDLASLLQGTKHETSSVNRSRERDSWGVPWSLGSHLSRIPFQLLLTENVPRLDAYFTSSASFLKDETPCHRVAFLHTRLVFWPLLRRCPLYLFDVCKYVCMFRKVRLTSPTLPLLERSPLPQLCRTSRGNKVPQAFFTRMQAKRKTER